MKNTQGNTFHRDSDFARISSYSLSVINWLGTVLSSFYILTHLIITILIIISHFIDGGTETLRG